MSYTAFPADFFGSVPNVNTDLGATALEPFSTFDPSAIQLGGFFDPTMGAGTVTGTGYNAGYENWLGKLSSFNEALFGTSATAFRIADMWGAAPADGAGPAPVASSGGGGIGLNPVTLMVTAGVVGALWLAFR